MIDHYNFLRYLFVIYSYQLLFSFLDSDFLSNKAYYICD